MAEQNLKFPPEQWRAVIKFMVLQGKSTKVIHEELSATLGDHSPTYPTVARWVRLFKTGTEEVKDSPRSGRPKIEFGTNFVTRVKSMVEEDPRISIQVIAYIVGHDWRTISTFIDETLNMRKITSRWVPKLLLEDQKRKRIELSQTLLNKLNEDPENFLAKIVTGDESWVLYYDPEDQKQSRQWVTRGDPTPTKPKKTLTNEKILLTVFWDMKGVLLVDFMPRGRTMNGKYYAELMDKLRYSIKNKRRNTLHDGIFLLHDGARPHKCKVVKSALAGTKVEELQHPPYSPDLAPSDYHLFKELKSYLRGKRFKEESEVKAEVQSWFDAQTSNFFYSGIMALEKRWKKCIESRGEYFD